MQTQVLGVQWVQTGRPGWSTRGTGLLDIEVSMHTLRALLQPSPRPQACVDSGPAPNPPTTLVGQGADSKRFSAPAISGKAEARKHFKHP